MVERGLKYLIVSLLCLLLISLPVGSSVELQQLTYDGNGNLITGDGKYRVYNEFNQLIRVYEGNNVSNSYIEEYIYHPTEDRILVKKANFEAGKDPDEVVVYVNDNFVRSYKSEGSKINDSYYVRDENGIAGELIMNGSENANTFTEAGKFYYHDDHLGSTSLITNSSGGLVEETFYSPYGEILSGGEASRYQYEGKEFSSLTDDYDYNFRKYNPEVGIFTQPEQAFPNIYDPQQLNRYRFERNNPYKYVDPDGKVAILAPLLIAAGIGAIVGAGFYGLEVARGDLTFSWKGLAGYSAGGAVGGTLSVVAGLVAAAVGAGSAATLGIYSAFGATGGISSQAIGNVGLDRPISEGLIESGLIGAVTGGFSKYFPKAGIYKIKYPGSYFTTKTGQTFMSNIFVEQSLSGAISTGNTAPQLFYNYVNNQVSQTNIIQQISGGGGSGCMCVAPPYSGSSSISGGGGSSSSSLIGNIGKTISNIGKSIGNIFRRIFG